MAEFRPIYDPAGPDGELRKALSEVRAGRWVSMRDLLARTDRDWSLRCWRSQVLAHTAVGTHAVEAWLSEEPTNPDAMMMLARIAVVVATRAQEANHKHARELVRRADAACGQAAAAYPADPVPFVCLLALARLTGYAVQGPPTCQVDGPWDVLDQVQRRDPFNREAWHRMMLCLRPPGASAIGAVTFASWAMDCVPQGSPLKALPLYAYVEHHRYHRSGNPRGRDPLVDGQWTRPHLQPVIRAALYDWFLSPRRWPGMLVLDLSHLAHALWAAGRVVEAADVFTAMGDYAATQPWRDVTPGRSLDPFLAARLQCLTAARNRTETPREGWPRHT